MSEQLKIVALLTARPGKEAELASLLEGMIGPSRSEPGNIRYDLWRDHQEAGVFVLDELYTDDAAVEAHRAAPHFLDYLSKIGELSERKALLLRPVSIG